MHRRKWLRTARERSIAPPPGGAHPRRVALVALRRARNNLGVSLLLTFLFAPAVSKRKVAMGAERRRGYCFIRRTKSKPSYSRFFFCPCRPKRKSLAKRKRPWECFAVCGRRGGLRALHLRPLAWGLWSALARCVTVFFLVGAIIDRPKATDVLRFNPHSHFSL